MKQQFLSCLVAAILFLSAACSHSDKQAQRTKTVITGKIKNMQVYPEYTEFVLEVADFGGNPTRYTAKINKDSTFKFYFDQYITQDVNISPMVRTFISHPGDSINIDIDYNSIGDIKFSGDAEKTNTDVYQYTSEYYTTVDESMEEKYLKELNAEKYKEASESIRAEMLKNRAEFVTKLSPNREVSIWTRNYIDIRYYTSLLKFYYNYIYAKNGPVDKDPIFKNYFDFGENLDVIYNDTILNSNSYRMLVMLRPALSEKELTGKNTDEIVKTYLNKIELLNYNTNMKQLLTGFVFFSLLNEGKLEVFDNNRNSFEEGIKKPYIKQPLLKYYASVYKIAKNPQITSKQIMDRLATTPAIAVLNSIKDENKGKVIYVNFWATWCGPCLQEMPQSKQLAEKYKDKNVAIAYVCLDSKPETWKSMLTTLKLPLTNQYFCDQPQTMGIMRSFRANAIPFYILIDKNGVITKISDDLYPGDPFTSSQIDKLLK